jgi:hypothetical protein
LTIYFVLILNYFILFQALVEVRQLPLPEGVELNGQENGEPEKEPVVSIHILSETKD